MSIGSELTKAFPDEISTIQVNKSNLHGEEAVEVIVGLMSGKKITGTFTKHPRGGFGGVQFNQHKDVVGLMSAKIKSIIAGTAEEV